MDPKGQTPRNLILLGGVDRFTGRSTCRTAAWEPEPAAWGKYSLTPPGLSLAARSGDHGRR